MDFRLSQRHGIAFLYVLPSGPCEAWAVSRAQPRLPATPADATPPTAARPRV